MFFGCFSDNGKVLKAILQKGASPPWDEGVISQSWQIFPSNAPIKEIKISNAGRSVFALTDNEGILVPTDNCDLFLDCEACTGLNDPHCAWDVESSKCTNHGGTIRKTEFCPVVIVHGKKMKKMHARYEKWVVF